MFRNKSIAMTAGRMNKVGEDILEQMISPSIQLNLTKCYQVNVLTSFFVPSHLLFCVFLGKAIMRSCIQHGRLSWHVGESNMIQI